LAPGGHFGLTCFVTEECTDRPDLDFYRTPTLDGGLGYSPEELRAIFAGLTEVALRRMRALPEDDPRMGVSFVWTALFANPRLVAVEPDVNEVAAALRISIGLLRRQLSQVQT